MCWLIVAQLLPIEAQKIRLTIKIIEAYSPMAISWIREERGRQLMKVVSLEVSITFRF